MKRTKRSSIKQAERLVNVLKKDFQEINKIQQNLPPNTQCCAMNLNVEPEIKMVDMELIGTPGSSSEWRELEVLLPPGLYFTLVGIEIPSRSKEAKNPVITTSFIVTKEPIYKN